MARPKGGTNRKYDYEFKLMVVQDRITNHTSWPVLAKRYDISRRNAQRWVDLYNEGILKEGRKHKRGNKFAALHSSKSLSNEERLELENLKLRIENERLKKGYMVKGVGVNKEFVSILDVNMKSSKH